MSRFSSTLKFALFGLLLLVPLSSCTFPDNVVQSADKNIASITIDRSSIPERIGAGLFDEAGIKLLVTYEGGTGETIPVTASMEDEARSRILFLKESFKIAILFFAERLITGIERRKIGADEAQRDGVFLALSKRQNQKQNIRECTAISRDQELFHRGIITP